MEPIILLKYQSKLMDIQKALTLVDTDIDLIVTICKEMAFNWVPVIMDDIVLLIEENDLLQDESTKLSLQNDSLLKQNLLLTQRLRHQ